MNKFKILALFGKSGAGKDTIQNQITDIFSDTHKIISYTTRPKRNYEKDGIDYYFISKEDFKTREKNGEMLETSCFNDWYYGTGINFLRSDVINVGVFNITGIETLLKDDRIIVMPVEIKAPYSIRLNRVLSREKNPDCHEICRRFFTDDQDFMNIPFSYLSYMNDKENTTPFLKALWSEIDCLFGQD